MKKKIIICLIILTIIIIALTITTRIIRNKRFQETQTHDISYLDEDESKNEAESLDGKENQKEVSENIEQTGEKEKPEETEKKQQEQEKISQIIQDQGLQADENIYEIDTEYDGREVVVVKSSIQYKAALAGILKKGKPEFSEINDLLNDAPTHTGIWVEKDSREKFLSILKNITSATYEFDEHGFLVQNAGLRMNKYDIAVQKLLSDEMLHVFAISSVSYLVDSVTGELQEYPFEEMDPYTGYEYLVSQDKDLFVISENLLGKIDQEKVIEEILDNR